MHGGRFSQRVADASNRKGKGPQKSSKNAQHHIFQFHLRRMVLENHRSHPCDKSSSPQGSVDRELRIVCCILRNFISGLRFLFFAMHVCGDERGVRERFRFCMKCCSSACHQRRSWHGGLVSFLACDVRQVTTWKKSCKTHLISLSHLIEKQF